MIAALPYDRPFPSAAIWVPPVRLNGDRLWFRPQGPLALATGNSERLVFDFANLAEAPREALLSFAQTWGVLGLCPHGDTLHHRTPPCLPPCIGDEYAESLARWRHRARHVGALLKLRAALQRNEAGEPADWRVVWPGLPPTTHASAIQTLGVVASALLSNAQVQPLLECRNERLSITFIGGNFGAVLKATAAVPRLQQWLGTSGNLLAELAMRTVLALQEGLGWAVCSAPECRQLYRPRRQPAVGRYNFCPSCGKRASWRLSKRNAVSKG